MSPKRNDRTIPRWAAFGCLALAGALLSGCLGGPYDRCYINDLRYSQAKRAFERSGSVEVVRNQLDDDHWPNCQINEAVYRIEKEFGLHDELPSPVRVRDEDELAEEEYMIEQLLAKEIEFNTP